MLQNKTVLQKKFNDYMFYTSTSTSPEISSDILDVFLGKERNWSTFFMISEIHIKSGQSKFFEMPLVSLLVHLPYFKKCRLGHVSTLWE